MRAHQLLAARLADLLDQRALKASDLATRVGVTPAAISQLVNARPLKWLEKLSRISGALRVPIAELFRDPASSGSLAITPEEGAVIMGLRRAERHTRQGISVLLGVPIGRETTADGSSAVLRQAAFGSTHTSLPSVVAEHDQGDLVRSVERLEKIIVALDATMRAVLTNAGASLASRGQVTAARRPQSSRAPAGGGDR